MNKWICILWMVKNVSTYNVWISFSCEGGPDYGTRRFREKKHSETLPLTQKETPHLQSREHIEGVFIYILFVNPLMPNGAFNICCPRDCVSRHNGGTSGAPLKPLRVDSALKALSTLRGLWGAPEVPPLCRETQSLADRKCWTQRWAQMG